MKIITVILLFFITLFSSQFVFLNAKEEITDQKSDVNITNKETSETMSLEKNNSTGLPLDSTIFGYFEGGGIIGRIMHIEILNDGTVKYNEEYGPEFSYNLSDELLKELHQFIKLNKYTLRERNLSEVEVHVDATSHGCSINKNGEMIDIKRTGIIDEILLDIDRELHKRNYSSVLFNP